MDGFEGNGAQGIGQRPGRLPNARALELLRPTWGARAIGAVLRAGMRALFRIEVRGLAHFTASPSTLVVANHRRDTDGPIIGTLLAERMDALGANALPCFVAREDLFHPGFLRDYLAGWPAPIRELLGGLDLRTFLDAVHLYPIRRIRERTLGEVLADCLAICGDLALTEVLRPDWAERFRHQAPEATAPLRVSDALAKCFRPLLRERYGLTKLTPARFRAFRPHEEAVISRQLRRFVDLLEYGAVLQLEPEGSTSETGALGRLRGGLHILLNQPRVPIRVLPVGITYDFMTSGRQRAFVNVGREISDLRGLSRRETKARVTTAMLACSTLTASQLATGRLLALRARGGGYVTQSELETHIHIAAERWSTRGAHVDPRLLQADERGRRVREYLNYCCRSDTLVACGGERYFVRGGDEMPPPSWAHPDNALAYIRNELMSLTPLWPGAAGRSEA